MLEKYALMRVIKAAVAEPGGAWSLRGIASKAKVSPTAAAASVGWMLARGMVARQKAGRAYSHRLLPESPLVRQWKTLFNLDEMVQSGLVADIARLPGLSSLVLYGSVAQGTDDARSDIDLLAIARQRARIPLAKYSTRLGREVNLAVFTPAEWRKKAAADKVFYERVIIDSIALIGRKPVVL
jgi:predicted nucleotidyltransferase